MWYLQTIDVIHQNCHLDACKIHKIWLYDYSFLIIGKHAVFTNYRYNSPITNCHLNACNYEYEKSHSFAET
jgi:hypothetical protein